MAKLKMIQVEAKTHTQVKRQANRRSKLNGEKMSIKAYVQFLADNDKRILDEIK